MTISLYTGPAYFGAQPTSNEPPSSGSTVASVASDISGTSGSSAGIHVDLSPLAKGIVFSSEKAESSQETKKANIEDSNLPQEIKELLKRIVEYREKISEKQQELEDAMRDQSLSDEQRQAKLSALQKEMSSLNSALQEAMGQLSKLVRQMDLDEGAVIEAMSFAMS
ncbi:MULTISPECIES: hypothetical protein [unclassified Halomonas]|uniref:hypothetical protein n=1 Tax=unclassified Halomonas TaxID=2609666 RepID=UPI000990675E|nr:MULTISPECIES: hypothetical protein [unclassified Halomonas]AQU81253.1 hypothetical protein B2G49_00655 [Halomonas sp. 'Soap Lake \